MVKPLATHDPSIKDEYKGDVKDYMIFNGRGVLKIADLSCTYTGEFKNGIMYGKGELAYDEGSKLEGIFSGFTLCKGKITLNML
jgi:hypothetical protein